MIFVINEQNKLLLWQRKSVFGDWLWGLPGGHREPDEEPTDSAIRELLEETGISIEKTRISFLGTTEYEWPRFLSVHHNFLVKYIWTHVQLMEPEKCYEWKFFNTNNIPESLFTPDINAINQFYIQQYG